MQLTGSHPRKAGPSPFHTAAKDTAGEYGRATVEPRAMRIEAIIAARASIAHSIAVLINF